MKPARLCAAFLAVLVPLVLLTGCWSRVEINDRAFVSSIFVDKGQEGRVRLTLGMPLPSRLVPGQVGSSQGGNPYATVSKEAPNLAEAVRLIQADLSRDLVWGLTRVVVLSDAYAKEGIVPLLEFLSRLPGFQFKTYMFMVEGDTKQLAKMPSVFERFPSEVMREFGNRRITMDTTFRDFSIGYYNGGDMVVGILKTEMKKLVSEKNKPGLWAGTDGAAVFHNNRLIGTLSTKEARGVQWMADKVNNAVITFPSPTDGKPISVLVLNSKTRVRPRIEKDGIVFQVHIYVQDELMSSDSDIPVMEPDSIERLQTRMSEEIKGRIMRAFEKSLQLNSDIFRFAEYMKVYEPKTWDAVKGNWHETYRTKVRLDIQVESRIRRPGETKRSLKSEPKDVG